MNRGFFITVVILAIAPGCSSTGARTGDASSSETTTTGDATGIADAGTEDATTTDGDGGTAADVQNDPGCPTEKATGDCTPNGLSCRYTDLVCVCAGPCSGIPPGPDPPTTWQCVSQPVACPASPPTSGSSCSTPDLTCGYGTCGGSTATCEGGQWAVTFIPPPP